ncbi:MAG TPA: PDZ domain-containing protein [Candidatus Tumulicola sp.]|nr:PDZ domain-containing protein [Candidatus Tumulicola sp.]
MRRNLSRALLVAVTLFVAIIYYVPIGHVDFVENWGEGTYGITLPARSGTVEAVAPGSPAAQAGIRPGDRLLERSDPALGSRLRAPYAGERETPRFARPGAPPYTAVLTAAPVPGFDAWQRLGGVLAYLPPTVFLIVAFLLVFLRPSIMSWSFYLFAVGYFGTSPPFMYWSHVLPATAFVALTFVLSTIFGPWSVLPLLPFVLRFPNGDLLGWRRKIAAFVWAVLAMSYAAYVYEWQCFMTQRALPSWDFILSVVLPLAGFALAALIVAKNVAVATPAERQRWGFLAIGTIASFVAYAIYYVPGVPFAAGQIVGFAVVLMPICIGYAVFRLRVIDVNFVLNRALVYGILSLVVIAFISLLDWVLSRAISQERLALGIELLVTIAVGFLLDRINRVVERLVEAVFFRRRRQSESYLRRAAAALPYATGEPAIADGLVEVPVDAFDLSAAALYRRSENGTRFEGVATSRRTPIAPPGFDADHLLVRMLLAGEKKIWLDELRSHLDADNSAIYTLAVPVSVRHELVCFTLYGAHANGAQLDPEEAELLDELSREASRAFDHVEAVRMRERYGLSLDRARDALPLDAAKG